MRSGRRRLEPGCWLPGRCLPPGGRWRSYSTIPPAHLGRVLSGPREATSRDRSLLSFSRRASGAPELLLPSPCLPRPFSAAGRPGQRFPLPPERAAFQAVFRSSAFPCYSIYLRRRVDLTAVMPAGRPSVARRHVPPTRRFQGTGMFRGRHRWMMAASGISPLSSVY